ncbi:MAG: hypothetical protein WCI48_03430 [Bacteroidota bacterium]|jgi:MFS transporter, FHS family, L-fucose permease
MQEGTDKGRKNPAAIYLAFFTIGLLEASFPLLNRHLNYFIHDEYYVRLLSLAGLLFLSFFSVLFSRMKPGKNINMWLALLILVPGMILSLLSSKSTGVLFAIAFFLLAGSLFVQVSGLLSLIPPVEKRVETEKIARIYLFNTTGLIAGLSLVPLSAELGIPFSRLLISISFFFLLLSMIFLYLFPYPAAVQIESDEGNRFDVRQLISNKTLILMLGGIAVYTGAEFCLMGLLPFYFSETFGIRIMQMIIPGAGLFMMSFFIGRITGGILLRKFGAGNIFLFSGILAILGISALYIGQKHLSLAATMMIGLGTANMLPMMISLSMQMIRKDRKWLVGMIVGTMPLGAFVPVLMWAMADSISIGMSITIPVVCLFYITWIGIVLKRKI